MNPLTRIFAIGALLLAPAAFAADSFEGHITMTSTDTKGKVMNMKQTIKGHLVRFEAEEAKGMGAVIMDMDKRTMTILMAEQKMYMVRQMPSNEEAAAKAEARKDEKVASDPDVVDTGVTEVILGYTCNKYTVTDGKKVTELWLAPGLGVFAGLGAPGGGGGGGNPFSRNRSSETAAKWERAFKGKAGFPLRVVTFGADKKENFRMEVTKIDKGGVSDDELRPPAGYQEFQMPDLGSLNPFKH